MARQKMVTRSMKVTETQVLMVNLDTQTTETTVVFMPNTYKDDKALMKALEKVYADSNLKPVHVTTSTVIEKLYGMTEKAFLDNAQELDPKTRKAYDIVPADVDEPVAE